MFTPKRSLVIICTVLGLIVSACGSFAPPESCGVGGTAEEAKFAQHFTRMELVNEATGEPGQPDQEGVPQFAPAAQLAIQVESVDEVSVRACIQERRGGGKIAFDQSLTAPQGPGNFSLSSFAPGSYVVRVIVNGILVKNLPFTVK